MEERQVRNMYIQGRRKWGGRGGLHCPTFEGEGGVAPDTSCTVTCTCARIFCASCRGTFDHCALSDQWPLHPS